MSGHRAAERLLSALVYIARREEWSALVGYFSCPGVIHAAARIEPLDRTQPPQGKLSTLFKEENKTWQISKSASG
jgi:hypothetical protein